MPSPQHHTGQQTGLGDDEDTHPYEQLPQVQLPKKQSTHHVGYLLEKSIADLINLVKWNQDWIVGTHDLANSVSTSNKWIAMLVLSIFLMTICNTATSFIVLIDKLGFLTELLGLAGNVL